MDGVKEILSQTWGGVQDCIMGLCSIKNFGLTQRRRPSSSSRQSSKQTHELLKKLLYCFALNGVAFGFAIYAFHFLWLPCIQQLAELVGGKDIAEQVWQFLRPILLSLFNTLWLAPMFLLSRIINCILFQDVADLAFEIGCGPRKINLSFTTLAADLICSVAVQTLFLIQSCIVTLFPIPFLGNVLSFFHLCLLYSLYAFEYKWINLGWPLHKRLACIDYNWPYFLGFGLPLALLTMMSASYIAGLCIFSIFFPLYIISGMNSKPIVGQYTYRLHIFAPVIYCWNFCTGSVTQKPITRQK